MRVVLALLPMKVRTIVVVVNGARQQGIKFEPADKSPGMRIVQALHWLKPKLDNPEESQRIRRQIEALLSDPKKGAALRKDLQSGLQTLPVWMQDFLRDNKRFTSPKSVARNPATKRQKAPAP